MMAAPQENPRKHIETSENITDQHILILHFISISVKCLLESFGASASWAQLRTDAPELGRDRVMHPGIQAVRLEHIPIATVVKGLHEAAVQGRDHLPVALPARPQAAQLGGQGSCI